MHLAQMGNEGRIKVIGTGSSGNSLVIYNKQGKFIVVDLGLSMKTILKNINYKTKDWVAAFCSHR